MLKLIWRSSYIDSVEVNLCWPHCLHFISLAYDLTHRGRGHRYKLNSKVERTGQLVNFQLFASNIAGNISHQKLQNCCVAKKLISHTFFLQFRVFKREFLQNHSVYWAQISEITEIVMLFQYSEFFLLASSVNDECMLMRQKMQMLWFSFILGLIFIFLCFWVW